MQAKEAAPPPLTPPCIAGTRGLFDVPFDFRLLMICASRKQIVWFGRKLIVRKAFSRLITNADTIMWGTCSLFHV